MTAMGGSKPHSGGPRVTVLFTRAPFTVAHPAPVGPDNIRVIAATLAGRAVVRA